MKKHVAGFGKGGDHPCGKAIGMDRDAGGGGVGMQLGQIDGELRLQQRHFVMVPD